MLDSMCVGWLEDRMGHVKRKHAFQHAQILQIQIILRMHNVSSRARLFKASLA